MTDYKILKKLTALGFTEFEYKEIIKKMRRAPNELELYLFSAMWSEHCGYKHSKRYLEKLPKENSHFSTENSGGISLGRHIVFFKTESHNHPSAVEPYQGAATGIGGILRDILAMNARPIALLNSLKFGPIGYCDGKKEKLNEQNTDNVLIRRNKHLLNGVVDGISDYGNCTGVPVIGGEIGFNKCFNQNPLVNVMAVGICDKNKVKTAHAKAGCNVVLIGSTTGRDGLFGAAFASKELEGKVSDKLSVQIGDPYTKKRLIEATLEILKSKNILASQDLGAAGLLSSTSEMAYKGKVAVDIDLDKVPLREKNMTPYEIMLSESQERMVFCANETGTSEIFEICKKYELNAAVIGSVKKGNTYKLYSKGILVASVPVDALAEPVFYVLNAKKPDYVDKLVKKTLPLLINISKIGFKDQFSSQKIKEFIFKMTASPEFASKRYVYRQYDATVGARTLQNPHSIGVSPLNIFEEGKVIGFSMDSNEAACYLNPYQGAFNLIFESSRNAISSGFEPLGITNCLNFANPEKTDTAYQFIQTIDGMADALNLLKIPVVSGNVSFYNDEIFPNPTIGMMSVLKLKSPIHAKFRPGDTIYLIGKQIDEKSFLGASLYQKIFFDFLGGKLDNIDFELEMKLKKAIFELGKTNEITGAIDVSKGGILGALLTMLFNSNHSALFWGKTCAGFKGEFEENIHTLFGEITGRYLIATIKPNNVEKYFIKNKIPYKKLGIADDTGVLDLGFTKINALELTEIYENSLERKAQ